MLNRILLFILRRRLKKYKHDADWYHQNGAMPNWYDQIGIPRTEKQILELELENEIKDRLGDI